jgi:ABC-type phosphate/phosphonate transport system substrate-binding protein
MRRVTLILLAAMAIAAVVHAAGWSGGETAWKPGAIEKSSINKPITLAVNDIYCADTSCSCVRYIAARKYGALQKLLKEKYDIDLKLRYFTSQFEFEKELAAGKVDGAICKPWLAFRVARKQGIDYKRVADVKDPDNNLSLWGMLVVPKDSAIKKLSDINGKKLAVGNDDGYEKYYAAYQLLKKNDIKPAEVLHRESCLENIGLMLDGKADAAVLSHYVLVADCAVDMVKPEDFRQIAVTEKIPLTSVILDFGKVSENDAARLQDALLEVSKQNIPEFISGGFVMPRDWTPQLTVSKSFAGDAKDEEK